MSNDNGEIVKRIARLNDIFRASILKPDQQSKLGHFFCTASIMSLPMNDVKCIVEKVALFNDFNESNDPYGEHDFGSFSFKDKKVYWKIDYENPSVEYNAQDSSNDPNRILTILFSHEY